MDTLVARSLIRSSGRCVARHVDIGVEQVAALAAENRLPIPTLNLATLQPSTSAFPSSYSSYRQNTATTMRPGFAPEDPWSITRNPVEGGGPVYDSSQSRGSATNGIASSLAGSGLPPEWWNKQESVDVTILGQQGFILNRYTVYEIKSEVRLVRQVPILLTVL